MKPGMQKLPWWSAKDGGQILYPTKSMATPESYQYFIRHRAQYNKLPVAAPATMFRSDDWINAAYCHLSFAKTISGLYFQSLPQAARRS
jgi:hypothetical protein